MAINDEATIQTTQFLLFRIGLEFFAVDINFIYQLRGFEPVTPIINAPPYIKGIMSLDKLIIPILDSHKFFNMPPMELNEFTVEIILKMQEAALGLIVEEVSHVITLKNTDIKDLKSVSPLIPKEYLNAVTKFENKFVFIIDVQKIFMAADMNKLNLST